MTRTSRHVRSTKETPEVTKRKHPDINTTAPRCIVFTLPAHGVLMRQETATAKEADKNTGNELAKEMAEVAAMELAKKLAKDKDKNTGGNC